MSAYRFKYVSPDGETHTGQVRADNIDQATVELAQLGRVISIVPLLKQANDFDDEDDAPASSNPLASLRKKKTKTEDVITVLRNLGVMAESGVPLKEALETVSLEAGTPDLTEALRDIKDRVIGGSALGEAMREHPKMFGTLACNMIAVGEEGGNLDKALGSAAEQMERSAAMRGKVINALIYPAILTVVSFLSVISLVVLVLPQFVETFKQMDIEPPLMTRMLMAFGNLFRLYPLVTFGVSIAVFVGAKIAWAVLVFALRIPVVGELIFKVALSRSIHTLAALTGANIRLVESLEHAANVSGLPSLENAFLTAQDDLQNGQTLGESLARTAILPSTLVQLISIGERTGRLAPLLDRAALQMENDADARLKAVVSLFEPILIVVMGGVIGMITLSIITPLFSIMQKI
jgi:type II secretory pathway component PulF